MNILKIIIESDESESNVKAWIGLILICLLVSLVLYYYPSVNNEKNLIFIEGKLLDKPELSEGGENPDYISIYLKGYENRFELSGCGLELIDKKIILKMSPGDSIKLCVDKSDLYQSKTFLNNSVKVLGIDLNSGKKSLTVAMINNCERIGWKRLLVLTPFLGLFLVISLFILIRRAYKEGKLQNQSTND